MSNPILLYAKAEGDDAQQALRDIELAKELSGVLQKHYPGHLWAVNVDGAQGVATIKNFKLSGDWGFLLHLNLFSASEYERRIVMAAGELLERYNLSRGFFRQGEYDSLRHDPLGRLEFSR